MFQARSSITSVQGELSAAFDGGDKDPAALDRIRGRLADAESSLGRARWLLRFFPGVVALRYVPGTADHVRAVNELAVVSDALVDVGGVAAQLLDGRPERSLSEIVSMQDGQISVPDFGRELAALLKMRSLLEVVQPNVENLVEQPSGFLASPTQTIVVAYERISSLVTKASSGLRLAPEILGLRGERTYFLALRNAAVASGDAGTTLEVGLLRVSDGRFELGEIVPKPSLDTDAFGDGPPYYYVPKPPSDTDVIDNEGPYWYLKNYRPQGAFVSLTRATLTADFSTAAPVMAEMAETIYGEKIDGVISVDAFVLEDLIGLTGPVELPDVTLTAQNTARYFILDSYRTEAEQGADVLEQIRQEAISTVLERVLSGSPDVRRLGEVLAKSAAGGHLALWMRDPTQQNDIVDLGLASAFAQSSGDYLRPSEINHGTAKIDGLIQREIIHEVQLNEDGSADLKTTIDVANTATDAEPEPVLLAEDAALYGWNRGDLPATIKIYVPAQSRLTASEPAGTPTNRAPEANVRAFWLDVVVPAGEIRRVSYTYEIDEFDTDWRNSNFEFVFQPQAVANPDNVTVTVKAPPGWQIDGENQISETFLAQELTSFEWPIKKPK